LKITLHILNTSIDLEAVTFAMNKHYKKIPPAISQFNE